MGPKIVIVIFLTSTSTASGNQSAFYDLVKVFSAVMIADHPNIHPNDVRSQVTNMIIA